MSTQQASAQRFNIGDQVVVRQSYPSGHIRTPYYIRGKHGIVADRIGQFPNPEIAALGGGSQELVCLYRIRFRQQDAWPDYAGAPADTLDVEIYEHWLEPEQRP
jgi:nitrile hydratase subunit beta